MSQRVAGCCCDKSDCDGTTLGTCCATSSEADPNCFGTCEGWDQFDVYLGAITDTTTSACDTNLGLVVGVNPDGSDQIVARVLFTPNADCTQSHCICKEDITCDDCAKLGGEWQSATPCNIACSGTCCVKNADGSVARCFDARNKCDCVKPLGSPQTYTFARGLECFTQGCVVKYCLGKSRWWKIVKTTKSESMNSLGSLCDPRCDNTLEDPYRSTIQDKYTEVDERYFYHCIGEYNNLFYLDYSQFNRTETVYSWDNPPFGPNFETQKWEFSDLGIKTSCFADGVCITNCNCDGSTYVGNLYRRNIQICSCCAHLNYDIESNVRIASPYETGSDPDNPSTFAMPCSLCNDCYLEGC